MRPYLLLLFLLLSTSMVGQVDSTVVEDADTLESLPNVGIKVDGYKYVVYPYNSKGYYLYQNERWDSLTCCWIASGRPDLVAGFLELDQKGKFGYWWAFL